MFGLIRKEKIIKLSFKDNFDKLNDIFEFIPLKRKELKLGCSICFSSFENIFWINSTRKF